MDKIRVTRPLERPDKIVVARRGGVVQRVVRIQSLVTEKAPVVNLVVRVEDSLLEIGDGGNDLKNRSRWLRHPATSRSTVEPTIEPSVAELGNFILGKTGDEFV